MNRIIKIENQFFFYPAKQAKKACSVYMESKQVTWKHKTLTEDVKVKDIFN